MAKCPCCGGHISERAKLQWSAKSRILTGRGEGVRLSDMQAKLFDHLYRNRHNGCHYSREELMPVLYGDDPAGGPEAFHIVSCITYQLNEQLAPFKLRVTRGRLFDQSR